MALQSIKIFRLALHVNKQAPCVTEQHFGPITTSSALAVINPHRTGSITAENGVLRMWAVEMCVMDLV